MHGTLAEMTGNGCNVPHVHRLRFNAQSSPLEGCCVCEEEGGMNGNFMLSELLGKTKGQKI